MDLFKKDCFFGIVICGWYWNHGTVDFGTYHYQFLWNVEGFWFWWNIWYWKHSPWTLAIPQGRSIFQPLIFKDYTVLSSFSEGVSEGIHKFTPLVRDPFAFGAVSFLCTHQAARQDPWFFQFVAEVQSRLLHKMLSRLRFQTTRQNRISTISQCDHINQWRWPPAVAKTKVPNLGLDHWLFSPRIHILGSDRRTVLETWPICHGWWSSRSLGLGWHDQFVSIS